jgi:hypothetical protein
MGQFWPTTADEVLGLLQNPADPHNPQLRQVISYWEMAAALVVHGAVSAELFVDTNAEAFFLLAKFAHILEEIRQKNPQFLSKTSELTNRFLTAGQRYEAILKTVDGIRSQRMSTRS